MFLRTLATLGVLLAIGVGGLLLRPPAAATVVGTSGSGLYQVRMTAKDRTSTLVTLDPETARVRHAVRLEHTVNAIGYDPAQGLLLGVASRYRGHSIGDGGHLVAITLEGDVRDLGPVRKDAHGGRHKIDIRDAYAGTVLDGRLHLLLDGDLVVVDVHERRITRRLGLACPPDLGDWDAHPGDGALYGVSARGERSTRLVRVEPDTGDTREIPVSGLPDRGYYGAVAFDDRGEHLYVTENNSGTPYRISLATRAATALPDGPALRSSDAAWRRAIPGPPTSPPTSAPPASAKPTTAPPVAPESAPPPTRTVARPTPTRRPTPTPSPRTPSPGVPPVPSLEPPLIRRQAAAVAEEEDDKIMTVRMGMVLLIFGISGAAAVRVRRHR